MEDLDDVQLKLGRSTYERVENDNLHLDIINIY